MGAMLHIEGLARRFGDSPVFDGVNLHLRAGEFLALQGASGVGKSTLLNCIAGLDEPQQGRIMLAGQVLQTLGEAPRALLRRRVLGFVFQAFHLLPHLSVAHNIALPLLLLGRPDPARVQAMLEAVGLAAYGTRMPAQLSGGQLQRVALARALVHKPALILADEPTGNLDPATAREVLDLLSHCVQQEGSACLLVTHSDEAAARASRRLVLTTHGLQALA